MNRDQVNRCSFCQTRFATVEELGAHLNTCGNKTELCQYCNGYVRSVVFVYHQDHRCTNPEESSEQLIGSNLNASTATRIPPLTTNDDSAFSNRRNTVQFASMRTNSSKFFFHFLSSEQNKN
jgi:hypothetical protein